MDIKFVSRTICAAFLLMSSEIFDTKQAHWTFPRREGVLYLLTRHVPSLQCPAAGSPVGGGA